MDTGSVGNDGMNEVGDGVQQKEALCVACGGGGQVGDGTPCGHCNGSGLVMEPPSALNNFHGKGPPQPGVTVRGDQHSGGMRAAPLRPPVAMQAARPRVQRPVPIDPVTGRNNPGGDPRVIGPILPGGPPVPMPEASSPKEDIDGAARYGGWAVDEFIAGQGIGFRLGNCIKYISRAGKKQGIPPLDDLKKAAVYLQREITRREAGLK